VRGKTAPLARRHPARDDQAELLDAIPLITANLGQLPERIQAALYQAFDIQFLYRKDMHQVTIRATITDSTPHAVAAIITDTDHDPHQPPPTPPSPHQHQPPPAPRLPFGTPPYMTGIFVIMEPPLRPVRA